MKNAKSSFDRFGRPNVLLEFNDEGAKLFEKLLLKRGESFSYYLDGQEISAPVVQEPIPAEKPLVSSFAVEEAQRLSLLLRSGALPVEVKILENRSVGPTLGKDSIDRSLKAGIVGYYWYLFLC